MSRQKRKSKQAKSYFLIFIFAVSVLFFSVGAINIAQDSISGHAVFENNDAGDINSFFNDGQSVHETGCRPEWKCRGWSSCRDHMQKRTCSDGCGKEKEEKRICNPGIQQPRDATKKDKIITGILVTMIIGISIACVSIVKRNRI